MYPSFQEKAVLNAAENVMIEAMARYDPSHDRYHVYRVRQTALAIAKAVTQKPDLFVVELAALLHDVLDKKYVAPEEAANPYAFFLPFFRTVASSLGIDLIEDGRAELITKIIDNVSWTTEKKLREGNLWTQWHETCVELHCVQDADRLDAIGAFGVLRCAAYSSTTNRPLHTPPDDPRQAETAVRHFYDKLLHITSRLKTEPGKKMGDKRHHVISGFLASIEEEYAAIPTLSD